ncbi:ABC transporter b family member 4 [Phtheirospermum japonicum]|uniref:ABC transporter b family member 4 n=1 Tax=Phtheirospermum japonicum TaxID=374723 RepID=A0A830D191_9LAMI|nr:ABC transporter b family member 4 [Phtheirospermum japonicum]
MGTNRENAVEIESGITNGAARESQPEGKKLEKTISFYRLFSFADSLDRVLMAVGTISAIGNGFAQPLMALIFGELIDVFGKAQGNQIVPEVSKVALKYVYLAIGCGAAAFLQVTCWMITGERQSARIRSLYLTAILQQDIAYFDREVSTGEVIGRMSGDTILIQDAIGEKVGKFVQVLASFLGGFVIAFAKGWLLTLVMLTSIPLLVASSGMMHFVKSKIAKQTQKAYVRAANVVQQTIGSIRTVGKFVQVFASFLGGFVIAFAKGWLLTLVMLTSIPLLVASSGMMYFVKSKIAKQTQKAYVGAANVVQQTIGSIRTVASLTGEKRAVGDYKKFLDSSYKSDILAGLSIGLGYTGGQVFTVLLAVIIGSTSLGQAAPSIASFATGQAAAFKMFETINRKPTIDAYDTKGEILNDIRGDIELRDVCFSYPARPKEQIFDGFSLFIPSGVTAALVGHSGSGKSTVISLIERYYDPHSGQVLIDGIDLREIQLKCIRSKIGLVSQEPVLFTGSIKDNIAYDTMVGENGTQLSGGQKQRVAIARAILKDPRILLLDEATSALDADSERIVQGALEKAMVNRTTVIVAHRLSTVRNASMIAVLHQGKIVEKGTHYELLKDPHGVYSNLIHSQEINQHTDQSVQPDDKQHNKSDITIKPDARSLSSLSPRSENAISDETSKRPPQVSLYRLAHLNKPEGPALFAGTISACLTGAILPAFGLLVSIAIKTFYEPPKKLKKDSEFWALMFLVLGALSLIAYPSRAYLFSMAGVKLISRIRLMCFEKVVSMEIGWFDKPENSSGVVGARLAGDTALIRTLVGDALAQLVQEVASIVVGLGIAIAASWQLALIVFAMIPLIMFNGYAQMKSVGGFGRDAKVYYALTMVAIAISTSSTFALDSSKAKNAAASVFAILERKSKIDPSDESGMTLEHVDGEIELERVDFSYPTRPGIRILKDLSLTINSGKIVALAGESGSGKSTVISLLQRFYDPDSGHITLDGIEINKFNLKWLRQQMGLVSQEPVLFNDTIRSNIASGKGGSATEAEIIDAAKLANAHQFISGLQQVKYPRPGPVISFDLMGSGWPIRPMFCIIYLLQFTMFYFRLQLQGYDTIVGERGVHLSGGQKQRVAIARAIVKSPKILLLDEATSALDAESEKIVQDALDKVMLNRTTVVVAHRLSTIRGADVIVVFKNGGILEKGNHNTLINMKDGFYSSLVRLHTTALS